MIRGVLKKPKILHRGDSPCLKHLQNVYFARHESTLNLSRLDQHLYESRVSKVTENLDQNYPLISDVRNAQTKLFMPKKLEVIRVPEFMDKYNHLQNMEKDSNSLHIIEGKVRNIRKSSKKLVFIDLIQDFNKVQLVYSLNTINEHMKSNMSPEAFLQSYESLKIGDSISFAGFPFRTKSGELSVRSTSPLRSLSPALLPIDRELDPKNKFVNYKISNYLANRASVTPLVVKHLITSAMRDFLIKKHNFIEVETPIISNTANGANANPFVTSSPHIKKNITDGKPLDLNLRIAPELYLKKLVIGGFDKVFEIGKMFRNEGIDAYHNPEFTTCEFYQSFTDLNGLIKLTENMLVFILDAVKKNLLSGTSNFANQDTVISNIESILSCFQKEARTTVVNSDKDYSSCTNDDNIINNSTKITSRYFQLLEFIPTIEQQASEKLPENIDDLAQLKKFFEKTKTILPSVVSVPNLLDKLAGRFIEPLCIQPTLIINHPVQMSPLSKSFVKSYDDRCYEVANRFELFINSQEYINAYEEENSPVKQSKKFEAQLAFKNNSNDAEIAMIPDSSFTMAMELGMPPTGGWGCGIDRLAMLVSGAKKIDDVLTFGNLKDNIKY